MIEKVTSAIRDASLESLYIAVKIWAEPLPVDGVTETGDAVPGLALFAFEHPLSNKAPQRIKAKRTFELPNRSETQTCEHRYTECSNTNLRSPIYSVIQSTEIARHWYTVAGFVAMQRTAGIKEQ